MKVLFIQLARLGDILHTIPVVRAYRRNFPEAKIDILVRGKFRAMAEVFRNEFDEIITWDSKAILGPLLSEDPDIELALEPLNAQVAALKACEHTHLINFSYSPFSSFLVDSIRRPESEIWGYSRHPDGYLSIPDDTSAYFYAQVGPGKPNRYHIVDLFAGTLAVDPIAEDHLFDWSAIPLSPEKKEQLPEKYLAIHVGASQSEKTYPVEKWRIVISRILSGWEGSVVLIGSPEELSRAKAITEGYQQENLVNLVGQTQIEELFPLLAGASLLIGADSVPIHIASMVDIPVLNLSFASVNFWETGPRSPGSRVLFSPSPTELMSEAVAAEARLMLFNELDSRAYAMYRPGQPCYTVLGVGLQEFQWQLVNALYTGSELPVVEDARVYQAMIKVYQTNEVAMDQLRKLEEGGATDLHLPILQRCEELLTNIKTIVSEVRPLVEWLETEKLRIGPVSLQEVLARYLNIHQSLREILDCYVDQKDLKEENHDEESVLK